MKKIITILIILLYTSVAVYSQNRIYVNVEAEGNNDGSTWYDAYTSLDDAYLNALAFKIANPNTTLEVWVAFGIYPKLTTTHNDTAFYMIPGVRFYGGFTGRETSLEQRDYTLGYTTLTGGDSCRVLVGDIPLTSDTALFDGFKFANGNATNLAVHDGAGVILKGNAFLSNCRIEYCQGNNTIYIDNSAYNPSQQITNLSNVYVQDNSCTGIYVVGKYAHLYQCVVNRNTTVDGYGIYFAGRDGYIDRCTISHNQGTGFYLQNGKVWNSTINNNTKKGGIVANSEIGGSIIANNDIYGLETSGCTVVNCNIVANGSTTEAAAGGVKSSGDSFYNSIFWGNLNCNGYKPFYTNNGTSVSHCAAITALTGTHNIVLSHDNIGTNDSLLYPDFLWVEEGVGSAYTCSDLHTQQYSVFVNAGVTPAITIPEFDLDGHPRIYDENENSSTTDDVIDIGVYEFQKTLSPLNIEHNIIYVKEGGAGIKDGSSWSNALDQLSTAIRLAHRLSVENKARYAVWVAAGTYKEAETTYNNYIYTVYPNINIYGSFVGNEPYNYDLAQRQFKNNPSILDGSGLKRLWMQLRDFTDGESAVIDGFTIQNGYVKESSTQFANGAGLYLHNKVKVANCLIQNNLSAGLSAMAQGAGIYLTNADTVLKCAIFNNKSNYRVGGIYAGAGSVVSNTIIANNESEEGYSALFADNAVLENLTVVNNLSKNGSHVVAVTNNSTVRNVIVWGNSCPNSSVLYQEYTSNIIEYSAIQDFLHGDFNLTIAAANDGDNANYQYPRFVDPATKAGNIDASFYDHNWSLKSTSNLIDKGTSIVLFPVHNDLAYKDRTTGASIDLGVYELPNIPLVRGGIIYITTDGNGDGSSWDKALSDVNYATRVASRFNLDSAASDTEQIKIWIKKGLYYGDGIACNPAFLMQPKVNVYGSFAGNESPNYDETQRRYNINATILDGQSKQRVLLQDGDVIEKPRSDVWYFGYLPDSASTWDGFIIRNGYTDCENERINSLAYITRGKFRNRGAGAYLQNNGFLNNCQIMNNRTTMKSPYAEEYTLYEGWGAGVFLSGKSVLYNCVIRGNKSASRCGGVYIDHQSTLLNCLISNNESYNVSQRGGAGVYGYNSDIYNTTIVNNKLKQYSSSSYSKGGGAFLNVKSSSTYATHLYNSVLWGNVFELMNGTVVKSQVEALNGAPNIYIQNCAIEGYTSEYNNTHCSDIYKLSASNYGSDATQRYPHFVYPADSVGVYATLSYNESLNWSMLAKSSLINAGSLSLYPDTAKYPQDIVGNKRVHGASIDLGAYEYTYMKAGANLSDTIYVTQSGCGDGTSWNNAFGDFQVALDSAYARNQRYGINKVNVWVAGGEYYGNYADSNAFTMRDGVNVYGGFFGYRETSLEERDPKTYPTYLKGNHMHRVLYQAEDFTDTTIWEGFIITEGKVENGNGGGAFLRGNAVLQNCTVTGNTSTTGIGGGVYGENGAVIRNTNFTRNTAKTGSAVVLDSATLSKCMVSNNIATDADGFTVVAKSHSAMVDSAVISFNTGGGVDAYDGSHTRRTMITANTGLGVRGNNNVIFNNLLINNNGDGGAQLSNNSKSYSNTIVNNSSADTCGGIILDHSTMINTLVWGNERDSVSSQTLARNHSVIKFSAVQDTLFHGPSIHIDTVEANLKLEKENVGNVGGKVYPFFTSPCKYKGVTSTTSIARSRWGLQPNSGCYNQGSMVLQYTAEVKDLNGNDRIDFGRIDIGAYELQWPRIYLYKTVYVSEGGRGNQTGVTWANAMPYIQDAIEIAEVTHYPVWVSKGNYYGDSLDNEAFLIKDGVAIYGGFAGDEPSNYNLLLRDFVANTSILNGKNLQRVLYQPSAINDTAIYDGFTVTGGYTTANGAGAYLKNNVILKYCSFVNNNADGNGGALFSENKNEIHYSYFQNNAAHQGGAIYGDSLVLKNNIIANNESTAEGGGLYLKNNSTLINNTIVRNLSHTDGGGLYSASTSLYNTLTNNILWGNKSIISAQAVDNQFKLSAIDTAHFTYNAVQTLDSTGLVGQHNISVEKDNVLLNPLRKYVAFYLDNEVAGKCSVRALWNPVVGSGVLNVGDNMADAGNLDINNHIRINSSIIDMGAIENQSTDYNYTIIYVKQGDNIDPDGKSWGNALHSLNDAILLAYTNIDTNTGRHPLVWVAQGSYTGNSSKDAAFVMLEDVQVTGGFIGTEDPDYDVSQLQRDNTVLQAASANQRILKQNSDFTVPTFWKNFRINDADYKGNGAGVYLKKNGGIDNFLIYNANAIGDTTKGGAIYAADSAVISRIRCRNCSAAQGGGIYMNNSILSYANISYDTASVCGGGIYAKKSYIVNAYVHRNIGGGIVALDSTHIVNNTIVQNSITSSSNIIATGSGVLCTDSTSVLNSIIWGNVRDVIDSANQITQDVADVRYSAIQGDNARGGHNGNIRLEYENNNLSFDATKYYPELNISNKQLPLTVFSSAIDAGDATLPTLPANIDFSMDAQYQPRVFHNRIDMGANEYQSYNKIVTCMDSVCPLYSAYTVSCGHKDFEISAIDASTVGTHHYRDTTHTADTVNIFYYTLKVKDKPASTISVSDRFISDISSVTDCLSGSYSGVLYWSADSGRTFSTTIPDTNVQDYYLYEERDNKSSCHTDTLSFRIYKDCDVNFSADTLKMCLGTIQSLTYFGNANDYTWTMDSTVAIYDAVSNIMTPVAAGTCFVVAASPSCIEDTVFVVVSNRPHIMEDNFIIKDNYAGTLQPTLETALSGTWSGSYTGLVLNSATGAITVSTPAIGVYPFIFTSAGGCDDTVEVVVGSSSCSFALSNVDELKRFRDAVNNGTDFIKNNIAYSGAAGFSGCTIKIDANIDLNGAAWTPIGTSTHPFRGTFSDGKKNAISRFKIDAPATDNVGFFGYIDGATISGIRFTCDSTNVKSGYIVGNNKVGAVVGYAKNSVITQCSSTAPVAGDRNVGAIVGLSEGSTITQCINTGTIRAYSGPAGGIVGKTNAMVEDAMNAGWVYSHNAACYVGGICGESSDTIQYALNVGVIGMVPRTDTSHIGNIVGLTYSATVLNKTFYDKQMTPCDFQAIDKATVAASAGLLTSAITGTQIQSLLNGHSCWTFVDTLYPTLHAFESAAVQEIAQSVLRLGDAFTTDNFNQSADVFYKSGTTLNWHSRSLFPITQTNSLMTFQSSSSADQGQGNPIDKIDRSCLGKDTVAALFVIRANNGVAFHAARTIPVYLTSTTVHLEPISDNIIYYNGDDTVKSCFTYPMGLAAIPSNYGANYSWNNIARNYHFTNMGATFSVRSFEETHTGWWSVTLNHPDCGISKDSIFIQGQALQTHPSAQSYRLHDGAVVSNVSFPLRIYCSNRFTDSVVFHHPVSGANVPAGCSLEYRVVTDNDEIIYDWQTWTDTSKAIKYNLDELWHGGVFWQLRHADCEHSCGEKPIYSAHIEIINSQIYFEANPEYSNLCTDVDSLWWTNVICQGFPGTDSSVVYSDVLYLRGTDTLLSYKKAQTVIGQILDTATHAEFPYVINAGNTAPLIRHSPKISARVLPNGTPLQAGDKIIIRGYWLTYNMLNGSVIDSSHYASSDTIAMEWERIEPPTFEKQNLKDVTICYDKLLHSVARWTVGMADTLLPYLEKTYWYYSTDHDTTFTYLADFGTDSLIGGRFKVDRIDPNDPHGLGLFVYDVLNGATTIDTITFMVETYWYMSCKPTRDTMNLIIYPQVTAGTISGPLMACKDEEVGIIQNVTSGTLVPKAFNYLWETKKEAENIFTVASGKNDTADYSPGFIQETTMFRRLLYNHACGYYSSDTVTVPMGAYNESDSLYIICQGGSVKIPHWGTINTNNLQIGKVFTKTIVSNDLLHCNSTINSHLVILRSNTEPLALAINHDTVCKNSSSVLTLHHADSADNINWYDGNTLIAQGVDTVIEVFPDSSTTYTAEAVYYTKWANPVCNHIGKTPTAADIKPGDIITKEFIVLHVEDWNNYQSLGYGKDDVMGIVLWGDDSLLHIFNIKHSASKVPWGYDMSDSVGVLIPEIPLYTSNPVADFDGKVHSDAIINYDHINDMLWNGTNCAAHWVKDSLGSDWYLPAVGETAIDNALYTDWLYSYNVVTNNEYVSIENQPIWTSTQYSDKAAWGCTPGADWEVVNKTDSLFTFGVRQINIRNLVQFVNIGQCTNSQTVAITMTSDEVTPGTITSSSSICSGAAAPTLHSLTAGNGGNGSYQWQYTTDLTQPFVNAPGTNNTADYTPDTIAQTTLFRRAWIANCGIYYSDTITVTVNPQYQIEYDASICKGNIYNEYGWNINTEDSAAGLKTYSTRLSTSSGCDSIRMLRLTIMEPTISITGPAVAYAGSTVTLVAHANTDSLLWYRNGVAIPNSNTDTLVVSITENTDFTAKAVLDTIWFGNGDTVKSKADFENGDIITTDFMVVKPQYWPQAEAAGKKASGVIFYNDNAEQQVIVASPIHIPLIYWMNVDNIENVPNTDYFYESPESDIYGYENAMAMRAYADTARFPNTANNNLQLWIRDHIGREWYLPAAGEMYQLYDAKSRINIAFDSLNVDSMFTTAQKAWTSTEYSAQKAWSIDKNGNFTAEEKANRYYSRAITKIDYRQLTCYGNAILCDAQAVHRVLADASFTITKDTSEICSKAQDTLHLSRQVAGTWSSSDTTVAKVVGIPGAEDSLSVVTAQTADRDSCYIYYTSIYGLAKDSTLMIVKPLPIASFATDSVSVCKGTTADLTPTVSPADIVTLNYQWQILTGANWMNVGTDVSTYTTPAITTTASYRVIVTGDACTAETPYSVITVKNYKATESTIKVKVNDLIIIDE